MTTTTNARAGAALFRRHRSSSPAARPRSREANLEVRPGEFVSVVGPSGCGKSHAAAHRQRPRRHHRGNASSVGAQRLGYVFQDATLLPWRTV